MIYLVGAAWLPLGFHAVDRWVRLGRRWGILELAVVLAMQTLGGDPQVVLPAGPGRPRLCRRTGLEPGATADRLRQPRAPIRDRPRSFGWWWLSLGRARGRGLGRRDADPGAMAADASGPRRPSPRRRGSTLDAIRAAGRYRVWMVAGLGFLVYWRRRGWRLPLGIAWLGLAGSAAMAVALSAAQLFPVIEFTQQTSRRPSRGLMTSIPSASSRCGSSGLLWPNVLGVQFEGNTFWGDCSGCRAPSRRSGSLRSTWDA